ncbi:ARL14 effector protein-like [Oppia nitens]|uniref:ARL14 effector protein-like n=1 Tax=Oppia nitens TaxID=1686743 RepID=UPI0023DB3FE5|nr:ARL14 effector protein-like [Oppia nitens]
MSTKQRVSRRTTQLPSSSSSSSSRNIRSNAMEVYRQTRRKRNRVVKYGSKEAAKAERIAADDIYDAKGIHVISGRDLCDCLNESCDGCFFACVNKRCKSTKCGPECRQKRKFFYETIQDQIMETIRVNFTAKKCADAAKAMKDQTIHIA